ncbi:MAG: hypothetical protein K0R90_1776 [Oscillospiraceae bacterium]|jgi:hypothetical protein|nr:hypothetical protein [Oscillospiraceae bacterium]
MLLIAIQFLTGYIPQGISFVLFVYGFSARRIVPKRFWLSSGILSVGILIMRSLPITFGVHTVLNILILIGLSVWINKLPLDKSIIGSLLAPILMFVVEAGYFVLANSIVGKETYDVLMKNQMYRAVFVLPIVVIFMLVSIVLYKYRNKKREKRNARFS